MGKTHCIAIPDCHFPYADKSALRKVFALIAKLQPTYVVQLGDLYDYYSLSRYGKSLNHATPASEIKAGRRDAEWMWNSIQAAAPKAVCHQVTGNHDARLYKKIEERLPELSGVLDLTGFFKFKGVTTAKSDRDILRLKLGDQMTWFMHGHLSKLGDHVRYFAQNVICGHSHRPGIYYDKTYSKQLYEANAGYIGDPKAHVFKYGATEKLKWSRGCLVVDEMGPRFVSLERQ